jgi:hypothetical protein
LTAAHLVFSDQTLSYVSRAHWFSRRYVGAIEPLPQAARGFYVLSGYAAQRTNDLDSGYWPGQSTPPSRNMDVAALYFTLPVAGGGHGGYLPSDEAPNTWLSSTARKMLVGYPVDGSQFGADLVPGRMYQTEPQPFPLSPAPDPVPGRQKVYLAPWLLSYPGSSGGPFYVELNDYFCPAGVCLGTVFSGERPYASVVRAIDSEVVDLIEQAAALGDRGTNTTSGSFIRIHRRSDELPYGLLRVTISPEAALSAGAGWRLEGESETDFRSDNSQAYSIPVGVYPIEFRTPVGYLSPTNWLLAVVNGGATTEIPAVFTPLPRLTFSLTSGLLVAGGAGWKCEIQYTSSLSKPSEWQSLGEIELRENAWRLPINELPIEESPRQFFRAILSGLDDRLGN